VNLFKRLSSLSLLVFACTQAEAATYYVATSGNDSAAGSQAQPWLTIQHAVSKAAAGDTVNVASGKYAEEVAIGSTGSAGAPITFNGTGQPVVAGDITISGSYIVFNGFTCSPPNYRPYQAVQVSGNHNLFEYCTVTNYGAAASDQATAIATDGSFNTIDHFKIINLNDIDAFHVWGHDITISNGEITQVNQVNYAQNHTDAFQSWDIGSNSYNVLIIGNYVHDATCQVGNTETDGSSALHDWTFANNIFVNIGNAFFCGIPNTSFYNNVFYNCGNGQGYAISLYTQTNYSSVGDKFANNVFMNNQQDINLNTTSASQLSLCTNNYFGTASNGYEGSNPVRGAANFVKPPTDFHLQSGSVLIGAGVTIASFNIDKDGIIRLSGAWCIGPYQSGSPMVPPAPAQLRINR